MIGRTIAHYRIDRQLGDGGMGVVYAAQDLQLERPVALKVIRADLVDPALRERFWREARAAAGLNHPNVCHLYEIGEDGGSLFITMELLEGETLAERLTRGPVDVREALRIGLEVLAALQAVHQRGFVHRDVKPSNVFLLADSRVKLLDFGLVLPVAANPLAGPGTGLTMTGVVMGSPRYMAPEQARGAPVDARTDLFSLAAVLQESITGRPVFGGASPLETLYAVLNQPPPRLGGSAQLEALGSVLGAAMAKAPDDRPADAAAMAAGLRAVLDRTPTPMKAPPVERVVRLAVLPFRMLRPDPDLEFLGPSLADAIAMSLAGLRALVVRSTLATARYAGAAPELDRMARELDVGVVLTGTLLPAGGRCRLAAQLVEAPGGRVVWSQTSDVSGTDVFELQDQLVRRIVESLQLPLSTHELGGIGHDVPATPAAYEFFLRANRISLIGREFTVARDLYRRSLEVDPHFAPAWARLGRCHRVLGKFFSAGREGNYREAAKSLTRALELHPDLPSAQYYTAQLELDGGRVEAALDRLLPLVERNPNDADGHAGLVTALRYAGLLDLSIAAHEHVRALDPEMPTSIHYTFMSRGEIERALEQPADALGSIRGWLLARIGRREEAIRSLREGEARERGNLVGWIATLIRAAIEGDVAGVREALVELEDFPDPEGRLIHATACAHAGVHDEAARLVGQAVDMGYANLGFIRDHTWFASLGDEPRYRDAVARAEEHHRRLATHYAGRPSHLFKPA